jgi:sarcosine oxidase subunit delta
MRIPCPHCGLRDSEEFRFGGEYRKRPEPGASSEAWADYLYLRNNAAGVEKEWWYHRLGCGTWFLVMRDTINHKISPVS